MRRLYKQLLGIIFIFLIVTGCSFRSTEDFKEEGEGVIRSLLQELKSIHTRGQLLATSTKLQRDFDRLVNIMIAAEQFIDTHVERDKNEDGYFNHELSDQLRIELNRLYEIEGGRQIIEKCQEKALHRLDAFEKRRVK